MKDVFLIIGAFGQIGSELVPALQKLYGENNVVALGHSKVPENFQGIALTGSVLNPKEIVSVIKKYQITTIVNFASFLSVK
ncbi:MAG: NAD-dependent epimerase/dehydratase family protein, partial [Microgenomates group bacterium]